MEPVLLGPRPARLFFIFFMFYFYLFPSSLAIFPLHILPSLQERYCLLWCGCGAQGSVDIHLFIEKCISTSSWVWFSIDRILVGVSVCSFVFFHLPAGFVLFHYQPKWAFLILPECAKVQIQWQIQTHRFVDPQGWFVIAGADCKAIIRSFS